MARMRRFGAGDDRRGAYIAGSSGSTVSGPMEKDSGVAEAFRRGVESNLDRQQADTPEGFGNALFERVTEDNDGNEIVDYKVAPTNLQRQLNRVGSQDSAFDLINNLGVERLLDRNTLGYLKNNLTNLGAFTTDPNEQRNVYQLLINKMFQGDDDQMRGALPLSAKDILTNAGVERLKRTGPTSFVDPLKSQGFLGDLFSLFTGDNKAAVNLSDIPGGGIAELPEFGQAGLDFAKDQGFRDYGRIIEGLITAATPLKYGKMLGGKTMGGIEKAFDFLYPNRRDNEKEIDQLIDEIDDETSFLDNKDGSFDVAELNKDQRNLINNRNMQFMIKEGLITPAQLFEQLKVYDKKKGIFSKGNKADFIEDVKPLFEPGANTVVS